MERRKYCYCWSCGLVGLIIYMIICLVLVNSSDKLNLPEEVQLPIDDHRSRRLDSSVKVSHVNKLKLIFHKADRDQDGYLDGLELAKWINDKVKAHLTFALKDNFEKYFQIDTSPRNGLVTWEEYLTYFFKIQRVKGITAKDIRNRTPAFNSLPRDVKVEIARVQAKWSEAVTNDPDFLTVDEFLAFEHPEASPTQILYQVQDIFLTFDLDGDGMITNQELETTYKEAEEVDKLYKNLIPDKHLIDTDGNRQISREEILRYMDPRNMHHAEKDANTLLKVADSDKDGRLKLSEVLKNEDFIVKSKFYDVERNLHNLE